jgi:hypothetical protein
MPARLAVLRFSLTVAAPDRLTHASTLASAEFEVLGGEESDVDAIAFEPSCTPSSTAPSSPSPACVR